MTEEQIKNFLESEKYSEALKKLMKIFPKGIDLEKIDSRIKDKLDELINKNDSIQKPIQSRKKV